MNIKEKFLELTEYTTPFKMEHELLPLLPKGLIEDEVGNYYMEIGKSETLFTCHLDTYCLKKEEVQHVIKGNFIGVKSGTTTLGGDNKSGVCILMYMIEKRIPGTYYFFIGEEAASGGRWGSQQILWKKPEFFKKFKRVVTFDRKEYGSLITRQSARFTCSDEFSSALIKELGKTGLEYKVDITGYYTDSATFMDICPEICNLSNGTFNEHTTYEYVDMLYLEKVCEAACKVDWESLPSVRIPKAPSTEDIGMKYLVKSDYKRSKKLFCQVLTWLTNIGFRCLNYHEFKPGRKMLFSQWHNPFEVNVIVYTDYFTIEGEKMKTKEDVYKWFGIKEEEEIDEMELFNGICKFIEDELGKDKFDPTDEYVFNYHDFEDVCLEIGIDFDIVKKHVKEFSFIEVRGGKFIFVPDRFEYDQK